jgi:23S rRNA (adenine2030-N6)-methyltransferase
MNYRHAFHAGNFADVFKHLVLIALIEHLTRKEKPLCYLDIHAGRGRYDLQSKEAQNTQEYQEGIVAWMDTHAKVKLPLFQHYLDIVKQAGFPRYYPGSPCIARACLRPNDRLILLELHPEEYQSLRTLFRQDPQTKVYCQDAYAGLKAFLPPKERRALIFIDPPYEKPDEWQSILMGLKMATQKFATGVYAIWYPITSTNQKTLSAFLKSIHDQYEKVLISEYMKYPKDSPLGLIGCGMCIINPPWQLEGCLDEISKVLSSSG